MKLFVTKDLEYKDIQESFSSASIVNSIVTNDVVQQIRLIILSVITKNSQHELCMLDLVTGAH